MRISYPEFFALNNFYLYNKEDYLRCDPHGDLQCSYFRGHVPNDYAYHISSV